MKKVKKKRLLILLPGGKSVNHLKCFVLLSRSRVKFHIWCAVNSISNSTRAVYFHLNCVDRLYFQWLCKSSLLFFFPVASTGCDFAFWLFAVSCCNVAFAYSLENQLTIECTSRNALQNTWKRIHFDDLMWICIYLITNKLFNSFGNACLS